MVGLSNKKHETVVDSFEVSCLFPNHVEAGFIPESNNYLSLCQVCQTPLMPSSLIQTLVSGSDGGTELLESEATTILIFAIGIYWAQYNLEVSPFIATGKSAEEIYPSPVLTDSDVLLRQADLTVTLDSLTDFGNSEYGSLEDYGWWFIFARDMLTWEVVTLEGSLEEEMRLGIQQRFAVLSEKNFGAFNGLVDRALARMDASGHLISFFREGLEKSDLHLRRYMPFEITVTGDTDFYGFCDSEDLSRFIERDGSPQISVIVRETIPVSPLEWRPTVCLLADTALEVGANMYYNFDSFGEPDVGFEISGHPVALAHDLTFKIRVVVPVKAPYLDELVVVDDSFDNFEVYFLHEETRIFYPAEPWISLPGGNFTPNFLSDGNGLEEVDESGELAAYYFPVFSVDAEPVSLEADWFRDSPWASSGI